MQVLQPIVIDTLELSASDYLRSNATPDKNRLIKNGGTAIGQQLVKTTARKFVQSFFSITNIKYATVISDLLTYAVIQLGIDKLYFKTPTLEIGNALINSAILVGSSEALTQISKTT